MAANASAASCSRPTIRAAEAFHAAGEQEINSGLLEANPLDAATPVADDLGTQIAIEDGAHGSVMLLPCLVGLRQRLAMLLIYAVADSAPIRAAIAGWRRILSR
jgi:hypothetical protein